MKNYLLRFSLMVVCLVTVMPLLSQKRKKYEFKRNLPVYVDSLIKDLTYPLAWGNSEIKDFDVWRKTARQ